VNTKGLGKREIALLRELRKAPQTYTCWDRRFIALADRGLIDGKGVYGSWTFALTEKGRAYVDYSR